MGRQKKVRRSELHPGAMPTSRLSGINKFQPDTPPIITDGTKISEPYAVVVEEVVQPTVSGATPMAPINVTWYPVQWILVEALQDLIVGALILMLQLSVFSLRSFVKCILWFKEKDQF